MLLGIECIWIHTNEWTVRQVCEYIRAHLLHLEGEGRGTGMASGSRQADNSAQCPAQAPKRRRDKAATKQALLAAAGEVFAERGYDAATTREVAQQAGVNEKLIQRYFGGKEGDRKSTHLNTSH